jgi:hypothetical protein
LRADSAIDAAAGGPAPPSVHSASTPIPCAGNFELPSTVPGFVPWTPVSPNPSAVPWTPGPPTPSTPIPLPVPSTPGLVPPPNPYTPGWPMPWTPGRDVLSIGPLKPTTPFIPSSE